MRRLPVYFLIDVSDSMVGKPLESVQRGVRGVVSELMSDPYALETAYLNIIVFAGRVKKLVSMQEAYKCLVPTFEVGGGTSLGAALDYLMKDMEANVQKTTASRKGDWKPIVFVITDGASTDGTEEALSKWKAKYKDKLTTVVLALGDGADLAVLKEISEQVVTFDELDAPSFKKFFKWVSASVQISSVGVRDEGSGGAFNSERFDALDIPKVTDETVIQHPDEHYVILRARCQSKKSDYLIKYRRIGCSEKYSLEGAYPINGKTYDELSFNEKESLQVNVDRLEGSAPCPVCGNPLSLVSCGRCGKVFCAEAEGTCTCPWCGNQGELVNKSDFEIGRSLG